MITSRRDVRSARDAKNPSKDVRQELPHVACSGQAAQTGGENGINARQRFGTFLRGLRSRALKRRGLGLTRKLGRTNRQSDLVGESMGQFYPRIRQHLSRAEVGD